MSDRTGSAARVPWRVALFSPILKFLLAAGVPMGFNGLVIIRGRKSGLPRTTPVAIIEVAGRRWVWAPWGDVQWVRNLRAAGRATIIVRRRTEEVTATELDPIQRVGFFRDILGPHAKGIPFGVWFIRTSMGRCPPPTEAAEVEPPGKRGSMGPPCRSPRFAPTTPAPNSASHLPTGVVVRASARSRGAAWVGSSVGARREHRGSVWTHRVARATCHHRGWYLRVSRARAGMSNTSGTTRGRPRWRSFEFADSIGDGGLSQAAPRPSSVPSRLRHPGRRVARPGLNHSGTPVIARLSQIVGT
jgi:deazaflavin-dependent oxidoreductase (nitroreductase family)